MRKGFGFILLLLGLALAPLPLAAQQQGQQPGQQQGQRQSTGRFVRLGDSGPVQFLLRNRAELKLTAEQVTRLEEVDREVEAKNRQYVTQLVQIRRELPRGRGREPTTEQRQLFDAQMKPLLMKIDENWKVAMRQVMGQVLTEEQKARIPALIENERKSDGGRDPRRGDGNGRD
jgi:hypothetical protein